MKKKTRKIYLYIVLLLVFTLLVTVLGYYVLHPLTRQEIPIYLSVGDYVGINLDKDALYFGTLKPNSQVERPLVFRADHYPISVQLLIEDIPFVTAEESFFILQEGEVKAIRFFAQVDKDVEKKEYTGKLIVLTKKL
ncbi:hypothetical protein J4208_01130 [Candidatus Woesearchaeota archaeon]|nr:hypothetical protein [Candidatus Woesearchaeota archaeon]